MVNSAGKMLREARLEKKLEIEEAARATKIKADRLADLENDDYTRFANMAYAKGFLLIYAKYLKVDISEFTKMMGVGNPVGTDDYEYLHNAPATAEPVSRRDHVPVKLNLKVVATVLVTVICSFWVMHFFEQLKRIGSADKLIERKSRPEIIAAPQASPAVPVSEPSPPATNPAQPGNSISMAPSIAANPVVTTEPVIEIRRAEPVIEDPPAQRPVPLTPSTSSTDAKTQQPHKSRTH